MSTPRKFLVVGCGSIGRRHAANLLALRAGEVVGCDTQEARRQATAVQLSIRCVPTLEEGLSLYPSAVFVTVPTAAHLPVSLAAARQGCHLFIEKPLAHTLAGTEELAALAQLKGLISLVGCNLRFHPGLLKVHALIDSGAVGRVTSARFEVGQWLPDWHPTEDYRRNYSARSELGGGIILDAIHELDYARWLLGEVTAVSCFAGQNSSLEIDTEDTAAVLLRFATGCIGEVHLDYVQRVYRRTCQIIGEGGTILWDYSAQTVRWFTVADRQWHEWRNPDGWQPNQMYLDELAHFLACLDGRETSTLDIVEARRVLEIALAAKESNASSKAISLTP